MSASSSSSIPASSSSHISSTSLSRKIAPPRSTPPLSTRQVVAHTSAIEAVYQQQHSSVESSSSKKKNDDPSLISSTPSASPGSNVNTGDINSSNSVTHPTDPVDIKMAQYREEMLIHFDRIQKERQLVEAENRTVMQSFMDNMMQQQQRMFEQMMNKVNDGRPAMERDADEDDDIHPSVRLSPLLSSSSSSLSVSKSHSKSSNEADEQAVYIKCVDCNNRISADHDGNTTRCVTCEKKKQSIAFIYKHSDVSPHDSSDDEDDDSHVCIDCHDRLNSADNTLRCPLCHLAHVNKKKPASTIVKKEILPSLKNNGISSPDVDTLKREIAKMRASTHTPARPAAKNISRHEQEAQLQKIKIEEEEVDRVSSSSSVDLEEEAASVLGNVLSRAFTPQQRQMFRYTKTPVTTMTARDRMAAVKETKDLYGTFTGDRAAAPKFLRDMCSQIQKYDFTIGEVVQMLTLTMKGEAAAWFTAEWNECCRLPEADKPIQILFHHFIDRWMDGLARRSFRDQLAHTRLQSDRVTQSDLQHHYAKFVETVNNLKMCDKHVVMSDIIEDYYKSLPNMCKSFIGGDFKSASSIEDIQRKAEQALAFMHTTSTPKQDGSLPKPIAINTISNTSYSNTSSTSQSPRSDRQRRRKPVIRQCYHCGSGEHWTGIECPVFSKPQTTAGKNAWKKRNEDKGVTYEYDKSYYEKMSKDIQARKASRSPRPRSNDQRSSRERKTTTHSDPASNNSSGSQQ